MTRGFTLVETLVAIAIIAFAIVGPFYGVQQALNSSRTARDQLIASSLAQEGLEYVRLVRDNNYLSDRSWLQGFSSCTPGPCTVDPRRNAIGTTIAPLYINANGIYNQQGQGNVSRFTREVSIEPVSGSDHEIVVTVRVEWRTLNVPYSVEVTDTLQNWL